jgi:outer membrane protein OmpA-like peptidoglycan-associated protein
MTALRWRVALAVVILSPLTAARARAQFVGTTPKGQITTAASACGGSSTYCGPQVLDPNSDGFVSKTTSGFTIDPSYVGPCTTSPQHFPFGNDLSGSEIPFIAVPQVTLEPLNDLDTGAAGGATDLVDSPNYQASFIYYDKGPDGLTDTADDRLLFRVRVGKDSSGAFGYSFLIDTDQRFGCATVGVNGCTSAQLSTTPDSNFVVGNPGFEVEIILATGGSNKGVNIVAVDGTTNGTIKKTYPFSNNHQVSLAATEDSCDDDVFEDFYVNFTDLAVAGIGITSATSMRFIASTSSSPASALGGSASDIGGVDDSNPLFTNDDSAFKAAVDNMPSSTFGGLGSGGGFTPTVNFTSAGATVSESSGTVSVTAQLSGTASSAVTVPITLSGTATLGAAADYTISTTSITIPAGQTSGSAVISIVNDALDEADETVIVTMGTPTNASAGATTVYTLTITDDDPTPTVSLTAPTQSVPESVGTVTVTVVLSAASGQSITVPFTVGGTASSPADYTISAGPITIAAGATTGSAAITVVNDTVDEPDETVTMTLGTPTNATLGSTTAQTVTIQDDDPSPTVTFAAASASVGEAGGPLSLTLNLSAPSQQAITIPFAVSGTATASIDYSITASPVVIGAGGTSATIVLTPIDDAIIEDDETVVVTLGTPIDATVGATSSETVTIIDNDGPMTVALTTAAQTASEGSGTVTVTVVAPGVSSKDVTVPFTLSGTATNLADYVSTASPLVIPAGSGSATATLTLLDDSLDEPDETVVITLGLPTNATLGAIVAQTVTVTDNDPAPVVQLAAATQTVSEGAGTVTITATLSAASGRDVTVPFTLGGTAQQPSDYTAGATSILIPAGSTSASATLTIVDDNVIEGDETVVVTLGTPVNATAGVVNVETITIIDNEGPVVASLSVASQSVPESAGLVTVTVQLSGPSAVPVSVPFTLGGTASASTDYSIAASPLVIAAGATSGTIALNIVDDALDESDETVVITLGTPSPGGLGAPSAETITIVDDDGPPTAALASSTQVVAETAGTVTATVNLTAPSGFDVSVPFTVSGSATPGVDFNISGSPILIPAGATSAAVTITVLDDSLDEADETVVISLGTPDHATLGTPASETITITDDDPPPVAVLATDAVSVGEGAGAVVVTVNLSSASGRDLTIPFTLTGTAQPPSDYTPPTSTAIFIAAGATSGSVVLAINQDTVIEGPETIIVTLGATTNATLGATGQETITIIDDDGVPTVSFTAASQSLGEASGSLALTLELSQPSGLDVTVPFSVGGTATDLADYVITASPIVIPAGMTQATVTVTAIDDSLDEPDETVVVSLGAPTNAGLGGTTSETVTIVDDDAPPTVGFDGASVRVGEAVGSTTVTVRLSAPSAFDISVPLIFGGTATNPADYSAAPSTIMIPSGQTTGTVTLTIVDDTFVEGTETVTLTIATPINAIAGTVATETVFIDDNDSVPVPDAGSPDATNVTDSGAPDADGGTGPIVGVDSGFDGGAEAASDVSPPAPDAGAPEVPADAGAGEPPVEKRDAGSAIDVAPDVGAAGDAGRSHTFGLAGGGGCSVAGPRESRGGLELGLAVMIASLWVARRRTRRRRGPRQSGLGLGLWIVLVAGVVTAARPARAQFQLDTYAPPPGPRDAFVVSRLHPVHAGDLGATLYLDYANDPLVYEDPAGSASAERASVVAHELVAHLRVSYGVTDGLLLYVGLPVVLAMSGRALAGVPPADGAGVGDPLAGARLRLLGAAERAPFALAVTASASLPLARAIDSGKAYTGTSGPALLGGLVGELRLGAVDLDAQAGVRIAREVTQVNLDVGKEITAAIGLSVALSERWSGHAEIYGATSTRDFFGRTQTPVEGLLGFKHFADAGWSLGAAVGHGFTRGAGSPDVRGVLMLGFATPRASSAPTPAPAPAPAPAPVTVLVPPPRPTPPPPPPPTPVVEAPKDTDQDGIPDSEDACPQEPEDKDGFEDADGCPDPDNDKDGVADSDDECPLVPGTAADKGCPRAIRVDVEKGQIVLFKQVEFATNRDVILDSSIPLLEEVRGALAANAQIARVRIEGHTDDRGKARRNLDLSRRRAQSVRVWLVAHGISAERLLASGCGRAIPIASNKSSDGRQRNRRVELRIIDTADSRQGLRDGCIDATAPSRPSTPATSAR